MSEVRMFDKATVRRVLDECREALESVAEKNGVTLVRKHCTYGQREMPVSFKLLIPELNESGEAIDPAQTEFRENAWKVGLKQDDWGKRFNFGPDTFAICGIKPRAKKYPLLGRNVVTGKVYKFEKRVITGQL